MNTLIRITARDPVVSRDGRPFGAGQGRRMRSTGWPLPGMVAGSFRTTLAKAAGQAFTGTLPADLLKCIAVHGLFPITVVDKELYLPAPADALHREGENQPLRALPRELEGGCDWPGGAKLLPVMPDLADDADDFKPAPAAKTPAFWPLSAFEKWLRGENVTFDYTFLMAPEADTRDHVAMNDERGAAADGLLFTTTGLVLTHLRRYGVGADRPFAERYAEITLSSRVTIDPPLPWAEAALAKLGTVHPLGGERRLVGWAAAGEDWSRAAGVTPAPAAANNGVTMTLVTPAVFAGGWQPGWLDASLSGTPPWGGPRLTLVGVCIGRWKAVSGWAMQPQRHPTDPSKAVPPGPKPVKRYVPAGGVYFFECESPGDMATGWLRPVSDDEQDRRDGYGLAAWGGW